MSLILVLTSIINILLGYSLTILNIENIIVVWGHRILGGIFAIQILLHTYLSVFKIRYNWKTTLQGILNGNADYTTLLKLGQRISGWGLIVSAFFVLVSGLDWFKIGTGWLVPFNLHISYDILLTSIIIIHSSIGLMFALMRRRIKKKNRELTTADSFSPARREAITVIAGMVLALISATYLDKIPRIADVREKILEFLPPGQYEVAKLRSLYIGSIPSFDEENWDLGVYGLVKTPITMSYGEIRDLPKIVSVSDFHCVTGWSKASNKWEGIRFRTLLKIVQPLANARFVSFECENGYTTSLPLEDLEYDDILLAYGLDDEDLPSQFGGPLRIIVPQKYGYKSGKWVRKIKLTERQELGYWETRGYSNTADPFRNDRYSS